MDFRKEINDMVYDQPREDVVNMYNYTHSLYDRLRNNQSEENWILAYINEPNVPAGCSYLKKTMKFLSRKISWIDRRAELDKVSV